MPRNRFDILDYLENWCGCVCSCYFSGEELALVAQMKKEGLVRWDALEDPDADPGLREIHLEKAGWDELKAHRDRNLDRAEVRRRARQEVEAIRARAAVAKLRNDPVEAGALHLIADAVLANLEEAAVD